MNRFILLLLFITSSFLGGCSSSHSTINPTIRATLSKLIESWCDYLCNYPKTIDEFVTYTEEHDNWKTEPIKDSVQSTLTFLKEEKQNITWNFGYPTITTIHLSILYYGDTVYRKNEKLYFPGLDVSLFSYNWYHLEYPDSIEELIAYDSLSHCLHQGFYQCCDETFDYLLRNKDKILWRKGDADILIMASNDTIAFQGDDTQIQYCDDSIISNKIVFRFFDTKGRYAHSETVEKDLKIGLSELQKHFTPILPNQLTWHILEYTPKNGLQLFCKNDSIPLDTEWFIAVDDYMYSFCDKHGLGRIIFMSPSYQK